MTETSTLDSSFEQLFESQSDVIIRLSSQICVLKITEDLNSERCILHGINQQLKQIRRQNQSLKLKGNDSQYYKSQSLRQIQLKQQIQSIRNHKLRHFKNWKDQMQYHKDSMETAGKLRNKLLQQYVHGNKNGLQEFLEILGQIGSLNFQIQLLIDIIRAFFENIDAIESQISEQLKKFKQTESQQQQLYFDVII